MTNKRQLQRNKLQKELERWVALTITGEKNEEALQKVAETAHKIAILDMEKNRLTDFLESSIDFLVNSPYAAS
ncbi:MAG: hypothetical protein HRF47_02075 [Chloroflexota bacterium]|jgi:hypothetical protein